MENKKEDLKKEEIKKEETKIDEAEQSVERPRLLKGFRLERNVTAAGKEYTKLIVETLLDKETSVFLSESHTDIIELVGLDNCYVDIEQRYSTEKRKNYDVIALHCGDIVLDFFSKDRAFLTLAILQAKKYSGTYSLK